MKHVLTLLAAGLVSMTVFAAEVPELPAAGDAEAGKALSATCAGCHGADGNSPTGAWPKLAGQHASYTEAQLKAFKSQERNNALMYGFAAALSEQQMRDLAAYFESQAIAPGAADPALVEAGEAIYKYGLADRGVAACAACHGPEGKGVASAAFPSLAGQWAEYTEIQLQTYRDGSRVHPMMNGVALNMRDQDIKAVASYIQGLR